MGDGLSELLNEISTEIGKIDIIYVRLQTSWYKRLRVIGGEEDRILIDEIERLNEIQDKIQKLNEKLLNKGIE